MDQISIYLNNLNPFSLYRSQMIQNLLFSFYNNNPFTAA